MSTDCIFCKIAKREIPVELFLETEHAVVFADINPATPVHYLAIPRKHIPTMDDSSPEDREILGDVMLAAAEAARKLGVAENGYRLVVNTKGDALQTVFHIHVHIMAGKRFLWPPG
jgi:histidine triad (HIT) family protein